MKPQYKKETFEYILKNRTCKGFYCKICYFRDDTRIGRVCGIEDIYKHVCEMVDLEEKIEEILH
jgi:hypothetical protein